MYVKDFKKRSILNENLNDKEIASLRAYALKLNYSKEKFQIMTFTELSIPVLEYSN